jgi:hypothetical protein
MAGNAGLALTGPGKIQERSLSTSVPVGAMPDYIANHLTSLIICRIGDGEGSRSIITILLFVKVDETFL